MENNKNVLVLNAWCIVWVETLQTKGVSLRQRATRGQEPSENTAASIQIYSNQTTGTPRYPITWQQVIVFRVWIIWRVKTACGVMVACGVGASKVVSEASEENLWRRIFYAYLYHSFLPHSHVLNQFPLKTTLLSNFIPYLTLPSVKKYGECMENWFWWASPWRPRSYCEDT